MQGQKFSCAMDLFLQFDRLAEWGTKHRQCIVHQVKR